MTKLGKKARARTQSHHLHWDEIPFILETCDIQWFTVKLVKWNICIKCVCAFHCNNQARWQRRWRRQQFGFCFYFCFVALRIIFTHFTSTSSFVVSNNFSSMTLSSMLSCHFHSLRMPVYGLVMRCHSPVFTFAFYSHLMAAATIAHNSNGYFSSRFASFNNWFSSSFFSFRAHCLSSITECFLVAHGKCAAMKYAVIMAKSMSSVDATRVFHFSLIFASVIVREMYEEWMSYCSSVKLNSFN